MRPIRAAQNAQAIACRRDEFTLDEVERIGI
jgi:hypothetical protein